MSYSTTTFGEFGFGELSGQSSVVVSVSIEQQIYSIESPEVAVEFQITPTIVNASVDLELDIYDVLTVSQNIQIEIIEPALIVGVSLAINVTQSLLAVQFFIEQRVYELETLIQNIEIQVSQATYKAEAGIEVQVYEIDAPSVGVEFQILDTSDRDSSRWSPYVILNGDDISNQVIDAITVTYSENSSAVAQFAMVPSSGVLDIFGYVGNPITIDYIETDSSGVELVRTRRFTGVVDKPVYHPDERKITFACTNNLQGRVAVMTRDEIDNVLEGMWSPIIFNENANNWEYFQDQLSTIEAAVWIDHSNILRKTNWAAGDIYETYGDNKKIYGSARVFNPDKGDVINQVNITLDFRYSRFIQRNVFYQSGYGYSIDYFLDNNTFPLLERAIVQSAASSTGWSQMGGIAFTDVWEEQVRGGLQNAKAWGGEVVGTNEEPKLCLKASFTLAKRWAKTITEEYRLIVKAPEAIEANGVLSVNEDYGITAESDESTWENDTSPIDALEEEGNTDSTGLPLVMPEGSTELENGDWMWPADNAETTGRQAMEEAQVVAMTKAKVEILGGSRSREIVFSVTFDPLVDLSKTVRLNTPTLQATGKVSGVTDRMEINTGKAITTITMANSGVGGIGIVIDTPINPVEADVEYPLTEYDKNVWLPWRIGGRTSSPPYNEDWIGYTTNYEYDPDDRTRSDPYSDTLKVQFPPNVNSYPEQFVVTTPEIGENDRKSEIVQTLNTINVDIPNDELVEIA